LATGFRNPDGIEVLSDGTITVPCSEGEWTPASMICAIRPREPRRIKAAPTAIHDADIPSYGYGGPRRGAVPELPLAYLPRGLDNSSGGQVQVTSDRWGPLHGQLLHLSSGMGAHYLVLMDDVAGQLQGAVVPLPGEFRSGAHRGRFHPLDGHLYVTGMVGWGTYTTDDGCLHRVRYTGEPVQLPVGFHVYQNGILIHFARPLDAAVAVEPRNHFAQCWNYRYGPGYGSAEYSARHPGTVGHDVREITTAHVAPNGRSLFLELPDLQPVNQLHLRVRANASGDPIDLFLTVHRLDEPYTEFPQYVPRDKVVAAHPILNDIALATRSVPNPWTTEIANARPIMVRTGSNLTFETRLFRVRPAEGICLTLVNPDVVPHNWVLIRSGALERVGDLANRMIADPDAVIRHYIPPGEDVLAHTDVVSPGDHFTIYFRAPEQPGRYPYLCTFPGHWQIMNGIMEVSEVPERQSVPANSDDGAETKTSPSR
jgi:azurin